MNEIQNINQEERKQIYELFLKNHSLRFSEISSVLSIRSNMVAYHLDQMIKEGVLEKDGEDYYRLTKKGEEMLPFFAQITGKEVGALSVVIVAIVKNDKICLLKRKKRPYLGYWGMIGGKLKMHESIAETAVREAKEETGLDCEFHSINAVIHERVKENDLFKHAFVLFLTKVVPKSEKLKESEEGKIDWFDLKNLNEDVIIPSDVLMIKNYLKNKSDLKQVIINEKDEKLLGYDLL